MSRTEMKSEKGFTLIDLLFTCTLIGLICSMAIPGLLRAKGVAQTASAIATLRVINSAQLSFAVTCGSGFYAPNLPALGTAPPSASQAYLPAELSSGPSFLKSGYSFSMTGTSLPGAPATCNGLAAGLGAPGYVSTGDPIDSIGNPHFFGSNADGTIYESGTTLSAVMPESGPSPQGTAIK